MMELRISVIIPYYEGGRWLPVSARSVLGQKGVELELIVVDDGSASPADVSFLNDERVRLIRIAHGGKGAAINKGTVAARGDIICVLDQDDIMAPGRLEKQLKAFDADPETDAVYSDYERVAESGKKMDVFVGRQASKKELLHAMASSTGLISMQTLAIKKSSLSRLGGFSEAASLTGLDDGEFFVRLICSGARLLYVPGIAGQWVSHGDNFSKGSQFNDARLAFLSRLEELCAACQLLRPELKYFKAHAREMRGIFFLEKGLYKEARCEFAAQVRALPSSLNAYYLLAKALFRLGAGGKTGRR
jgi:glycosyltransferase involved in cell wall biosynthesis